MKLSRREFFIKSAGAIVVVSTSGFISTIITSCSDNPTDSGNSTPLSTIQGTVVNNEISIALASSAIENKNTRALVVYNNNNGAIIAEHNSDDTYKAISGICTHQACKVSDYDDGQSVFVCPCHNSRFDLNGNVVQGPATTKLRTYSTRVENNSLIITL
ncbi:MAG: ubiquinol-cytochrome c reductase iron-sulfur subunit [Ignavibacteriales bacterium]